MSKKAEAKVVETVTAPTTDEKITVVAETDPNAPTTDEEVVETVTAKIGDKETEVLVIDETPKVKVEKDAPTIFVKLRDGSSCWGSGPIFLSNAEIKEVPDCDYVRRGIQTQALILCDKDGTPL